MMKKNYKFIFYRVSSSWHSWKNGLTLVELALILAIILIIVAFSIIEFGKRDNEARRSSTAVSMKALVDALKMYRLENDGHYPPEGSVRPLAPYTDITRLFGSFDMTKDVITGVKGVAVDIEKNGEVACIYGIVNRIDPEYRITLCTEDGGTKRTNTTTQPNCCWTEGGVNCANDNNWYSCSEKM